MQRVINRNKCIEKNLCITLVIYQESLHDARSSKCKRLLHIFNGRVVCTAAAEMGFVEFLMGIWLVIVKYTFPAFIVI